jgi:5'-nucleotidase/UDP-sugar diphosphatase
MHPRTCRLLPALAAAAALAFLLSGCTCPAPPPEHITQAPGPRVFTIIGTADLQGQLEPVPMTLDLDGDGEPEDVEVGGIARLATLISRIESERPGTVAVVSTGDDLMNRYFHTFKGRAIFELMSLAGYDVYAYGNHEFDKGPEVLAEALGYAGFDVVCTDLEVEGTVLDGLSVPLLIKDYDGILVGYFSLMTEDFPLVTSGKGIDLKGDNIEIARWALGELRARGAEIVVGLTHVGEDRDREIAEAVPGIDVIFGGHSHEYLGEVERVGDTQIVNGGEKGIYLVRLDVAVTADGDVDVGAGGSAFDLIPVTQGTPADAEVEATLAGYSGSFPDAVVLGRTEVAWDMTRDAIRGGESPVANLVNDLMREKFQVDVVLNNAGAFRGKKIYEPGPVTDVMLREIDEFSNYAYALDLEGLHILSILERSAASFGEGGLLHASGLRYTIDLSRTPQEIVQDEGGGWTVVTPGERVTDVLVMSPGGEWEPLDPDRTYRVLSNSFIVRDAGDGYFWFAEYGENPKNTYSTFYSILAELAGNRGVLNPGEPDGRLTVSR